MVFPRAQAAESSRLLIYQAVLWVPTGTVT